MCNRFQIYSSGLVSLVAMAVCATSSAVAAEPAPSAAIYHADAEHLWNRLYAALFVRTGPDGVVYGRDRLEPLLWKGSRHLLEGPSHQRAAAVLDEFVEKRGEKLIDDPPKRALLQRDLWLVYGWLAGRTEGKSDLDAGTVRAAQDRLRRPLATIIGRLALTRTEIEALPDNYQAAVASEDFARRFDAGKPERPYLPSDLFSADGTWVCVGRIDGVTAPEHLREDRSYGFNNSVFLVFLRLPGGRAAATEYLKELPRFPAGTEVALVRRALLIDETQRVVPSPLVESVQLRVGGDGMEFRLSRAQLFAGKRGGLRPLGAEELDFKTGFGGGHWDEFEEVSQVRPLSSALRPITKQCVGCHNRERFPDLLSGSHLGEPRPWLVKEMPLADISAVAAKTKEKQPSFAALRKLLAE